jgi:hypothetical protein
MRCPLCGGYFKSPVAVAGGEAGGKARVAKGFASPRVQALALKTRKRNARAKRSPNASRLPPERSDGRQDAVIGHFRDQGQTERQGDK